MRESSYNSSIAGEIEEEIGGRVIKLSDRATLGLPDSLHILDGIVSFIEVKIGDKFYSVDGHLEVEPWRSIDDLRQYELCRSISKHATVIYMIYYPEIKMTAVLPMKILEYFSPRQGTKASIRLHEDTNFVNGHGLDALKQILSERRDYLRGKLNSQS
jgi:hypothetical protein